MDGLSSVQRNVASLGASQLTSPQSWRTHSHPAMDAAATTLGMSASDLRTALQSGQTLAQIASAQGVSQNDLVTAISNALQQADSNLSSDQATQLATTLATGTQPAGQAQPYATGTTGTSSTYNILA